MRYLMLILAVTVSACATAPQKPFVKKDIQTEFKVDQDFEKTWSKLVSFATKAGMNIKTIDKSSGVMTFEKVIDESFAKQNLDCPEGRAIFNIPYYGPLNLNITVTPKGKTESTLNVNLFGSVGYNNALNAKEPCYSNGKFETEVFSAISK